MKTVNVMINHIQRPKLHHGGRYVMLGMVFFLVTILLILLSILIACLTILLQDNVHLLTMMMVVDVHGYHRQDDSQAEHDYGQSLFHQ